MGAPLAGIDRIVSANRAAGHHFFDADALHFFNSTIYPRVYAERYFITSEFYDEDHPEGYSLRAALDNGHIASVGDFQGFASYEATEDALIFALGRGEIETRFDPYDSDVIEADADPRGFHWRTYIGELPVGVRTDRAAADQLTRELSS
jgi:hypothetical protein